MPRQTSQLQHQTRPSPTFSEGSLAVVMEVRRCRRPSSAPAFSSPGGRKHSGRFVRSADFLPSSSRCFREGEMEIPPDKSSSAHSCAACHARKVRCDATFVKGSRQACTHCQRGNVDCIPHVRKRRKDASTPQANSLKRPRRQSPSVGSKGLQSTPQATKASPPSSYLGRSEYVPAHIPIDEEDASRYGEHVRPASMTQTLPLGSATR